MVDELRSEIDEVIDSWDGQDGELERLKKVLAYAKRLN
jgi:hypothetical protein